MASAQLEVGVRVRASSSDTLNLAPGERDDAIVDCQEPGVWAFHCHILTHAESPHGMFGMVSALIIK